MSGVSVFSHGYHLYALHRPVSAVSLQCTDLENLGWTAQLEVDGTGLADSDRKTLPRLSSSDVAGISTTHKGEWIM